MVQKCVILGIDPGSRITGYGLIEAGPNYQRYLNSGCIRTQADNLSERLQQIFSHLRSLIEQYQPTEAAVEQVFLQHNVASALKLGQARGAALVAASLSCHTIAEYSPRQIKQAVVGYGAAQKTQVQHMVQLLLKLSGKPQIDAADALAVAICHAHSRTIQQRLTAASASP